MVKLQAVIGSVVAVFIFSTKAFSAEAQKTSPDYAFFVGSELPKEKWQNDACDFLVKVAQQVDPDAEAAKCTRKVSVSKFLEKTRNKQSYIFDHSVKTNIFLWQDLAGESHVYISNTLRKDDTEFKHAEWNINTTDKNKWRDALSKLAANAILYQKNVRKIKEFVLINGLTESEKVAFRNDQFVDAKTGGELDFDTAYEMYKGESQIRNRNYLAASLEIALVLGAGVTWYYSNVELNSIDWDYSVERSLKSRFASLEAYRFDDNDNAINRKHLNAGAAYYVIGRINGFSRLESFLMGFASSAFWEYFVEFREVVSINDQILTPVGGYVLGEALYQVGSTFVKQYSKYGRHALISIFGGGSEADQWFKKNMSRSKADMRLYGFDPKVFTYMHAGIKSDKVRAADGTTQDTLKYYVDSEIIDIPLFNEPGKVRRLEMDSTYTKLLVESSIGDGALSELKILAQTAWAAYYEKDMSKDADGNLRGYNILITPMSGLDVSTSKQMGVDGSVTYNDMVATVNVVGAKMNLVGRMKGVTFRAEMAVMGDFAMVTSFALKEYKKTNDISGAPSVVKEQGYYYGNGMTGVFGLSASYSWLEVGGGLKNNSYSSINERPRDMETVTKNLEISDQRLEQELYVKFHLSKDLKIKCGVSRLVRSGTVDDFVRKDEAEYRESCSLGYRFF